MAEEKETTKLQELAYELKVEDAMTRKVITVTPQHLVSDLREILRVNRISGTPVVDGDKLVGLISIEDFIKCLADGEINTPIGEKMIKEVRTLYADEPLVHAVGRFNRYGFGRFPVIDRRRGKLVGIITKGDIIQGLLKRLEVDYHEEEIHRYRASHIFEDIIADKTTLVFQYKVAPQDFKRAGEAASNLKKTLSRLGIHPQVLRRVSIATYEAEMNIVIFTDGGEINVEVVPDQIKIEAVDSGPGIPDIEKALRPGFSTAPEWVRELGFGAGMGLNNIQNCADKMDLVSTVDEGTDLKIAIYTDGKDDETPRDSKETGFRS